MANMRGFHVGAAVRLKSSVWRGKRGTRQVTTIARHIPDVEGGVWLADALDDFRAWNVADLEPVRFRPERGDHVAIKTGRRS